MAGNTLTLLRRLMFTLRRQGCEILWPDVISTHTVHFSHIHTELD